MNTNRYQYGGRVACDGCGRDVRLVNGNFPRHYDEWGDPCPNSNTAVTT